MSLINKKVIHKTFGDGTIVNVENGHITVYFNEDKTFEYPKAFIDGFLSMDDPELDQDIKEYKAEKERLKMEEEEAKRIAAEEAKLRELKKEEENRKKHIKEIPKMNYAFKLNHCDGGASEDCVGFCGACTDSNIKFHIQHGADSIWCKQPENLCNQYYYGKITRVDLDRAASESRFLCYESRMLLDWIASAGTNNADGPRKGTTRTIPELGPNKLCVLTTVNPNDSGDNRYVFGAFIIGSCAEGDNEGNEGFVKALDGFTVSFTPDEAKKIPFWDCYTNPDSPDSKLWGQGLYRKFKDDVALLFFDKMLEATDGNPNHDVVKRMKEYYISHN